MERDIIGIFLGKDKIQISSINKRKEYRQIGFHGEVEYSYNSTADIDECITCLENTYNVDALSELDVDFYIVDCGANLSLKNYLLRKIECCKKVSSVFVIDLLYATTRKRKLICPGYLIGLDFLDKNTYICNESYQWINNDTESSTEMITIKDFMMMLVFDIRDYQVDDSELKKKLSEQKLAWDNEKKELLKELKQSLLQNSICHMKELKKQKEKENIYNKRELIMIEYEKCGGELRITKETCSIVTAKDAIAWIVTQDNERDSFGMKFDFTAGILKNGREKRTRVKTDYAGKIAWLVPNNQIIKKCIVDYPKWRGHLIPIAVIGDVNDDVESMIKWGRNQNVKFK